MAGLETGSMVLKHTHPYSLEELHDLDTNHISEEILRLQKSIQMLESTNATLFDSIAASSNPSSSADDVLSEEDSKLFQDTIQENEDAILAQKERIEMCIYVLKKRLGIDPSNKHYDLDPNTTAITARDVTPTQNGQQQIRQAGQENQPAPSQQDMEMQRATQDEEGDGMYL